MPSSASAVPNLFLDLLHQACGRLPAADVSGARRLQLTIGSLIGAVVLSAVWGAAAGSGGPALAAANLFKVPAVVLLSALLAFPTAAVVLKLSRTRYSARDLFASVGSATFAGALILAVLSPIVALYYHTSSTIGASLAIGSTFVALGVAGWILTRNALARRPEGESRRTIVVVTIIFLVLAVAAMLQLTAVLSPILPEVTPFDGGIDRLLGG